MVTGTGQGGRYHGSWLTSGFWPWEGRSSRERYSPETTGHDRAFRRASSGRGLPSHRHVAR